MADSQVQLDFQQSPVCSHNEWDPLEEVIVGRVEGELIGRRAHFFATNY